MKRLSAILVLAVSMSTVIGGMQHTGALKDSTSECKMCMVTYAQGSTGVLLNSSNTTGNVTNANNNNTTVQNQNQSKDTRLHIRIAVSGSPESFTEEKLAWCKENGVTEIHIVPQELAAYPELAQSIWAHGMYPVYSPEFVIWASTGFQNVVLDWRAPQLQAIKDAGWIAFSSEGLTRSEIVSLNQYLPVISLAGDDGADLYHHPAYLHPLDSHISNYPEYYYSEYQSNYVNTITECSKITPKHIGITLGLWGYGSSRPADLSMNPQSIDLLLRQLNANNVNLNGFTFNFWSGTWNPFLALQQDLYGYGGTFAPVLRYVQSLEGLQYTPPP